MKELIKRKSGGQPGNQNARKHGFYSKVLTEEEQRQLKCIDGVDGLDQEIGILRIKLWSLLSQDGQNLRLITKTAETLSRLYHIKNMLGSSDSEKLMAAIRGVLDEFIISGSAAPNALPLPPESKFPDSPPS